MKCQCCGDENETVSRYRQKTCYHEEDLNWATLCDHCKIDNDAYWEDRWREVNSW